MFSQFYEIFVVFLLLFNIILLLLFIFFVMFLVLRLHSEHSFYVLFSKWHKYKFSVIIHADERTSLHKKIRCRLNSKFVVQFFTQKLSLNICATTKY